MLMCERELILDGVKTRLRLILPLVSHETVGQVLRPQVIVGLFKRGIGIQPTVM
jgi:hypothetical protein